MTKLGIIGAMDVEVETLLSEMEQVASTKKAGSTFHEGVLMGLPVVLVQCGVAKSTRRCACRSCVTALA